MAFSAEFRATFDEMLSACQVPDAADIALPHYEGGPARLKQWDDNRDNERVLTVALKAEEDGAVVRASPFELDQHSQWFHGLVSSDATKSTEDVKIVPGDGESLQRVVASMYSGNIVISPTTLLGILAAADYLVVDEVMTACLLFGERTIDHSVYWAEALYAISRAVVGMGNIQRLVIAKCVDVLLTGARWSSGSCGSFRTSPNALLARSLAGLPKRDRVGRLRRDVGTVLRAQPPESLVAVLLLQIDRKTRFANKRKQPCGGYADVTELADAELVEHLGEIIWESMLPAEIEALIYHVREMARDTPCRAAAKDFLLLRAASAMGAASPRQHTSPPVHPQCSRTVWWYDVDSETTARIGTGHVVSKGIPVELRAVYAPARNEAAAKRGAFVYARGSPLCNGARSYTFFTIGKSAARIVTMDVPVNMPNAWQPWGYPDLIDQWRGFVHGSRMMLGLLVGRDAADEPTAPEAAYADGRLEDELDGLLGL